MTSSYFCNGGFCPWTKSIFWSKLIATERQYYQLGILWWVEHHFIELEHHFSNIKQTRTCSSIGDLNWNTLFLPSKKRTLNLIGPLSELMNLSSNSRKHHFFEHRTDSNMFIFWLSNSNTLFLASNGWTLNFEHSTSTNFIDNLTDHSRK